MDAHKWHINAEIIDRDPKLGGEVIDKFFTENTKDTLTHKEEKKDSDENSETSQETKAESVETSTSQSSPVAAKGAQDNNMSNLFLILGALFLVLGFASVKLFD